MSIQWKKSGYDIDSLLERIHRLRHTFDVNLYLPVFLTALSWPKDIPEAERFQIIKKSILPALEGDCAPEQRKVLQALEDNSRVYLKTRPVEYVFATTVSISSRLRVSPRKHLGCNLRFSKTMPKAFKSEWVDQKAELHSIKAHPAKFKAVRVSLLTRSAEEAWRRGSDAVDLLRGIWNFGVGRRRFQVTLMGEYGPFNRVMLGPQATLHWPDGRLADEKLQPFPFVAKSPVTDPSEWQAMLLVEQQINRALRKISYRHLIENAFIRYCRAMDDSDLEASLLQLWSILEQLAASGGDRYDILIRRVSALWDNPEPYRSVLQHLREIRNSYVHAGHSSEEIEALVGQLKFFVEELIGFHLAQGHQFSKFEEASQFLDYSSRPEVLERQIDLRRLALRYRTKK